MKRMLISAACVVFIFGTAFAREVTASPTFVLHGASVIAARRAAQLYSDPLRGGVQCTTEYIPTRDDEGWYVRKDVDCEE
jgi:hypothetical protein